MSISCGRLEFCGLGLSERVSKRVVHGVRRRWTGCVLGGSHAPVQRTQPALLLPPERTDRIPEWCAARAPQEL
jgi:hypothetical protein